MEHGLQILRVEYHQYNWISRQMGPAAHLFWSKSGKNPPEGGSGGSMTPIAAPTTTAASITSDRSLSLHIGPLIAQYKTNTEDGQFASFLADFERALN